MTNSSNPFYEIRSEYSVFQVEIYTRRSMSEGFTWVLGTNQFGDVLSQNNTDPNSQPFTNNPSTNPYTGLDAISIDVNTHIDPSGKQSPNTATVTLNENILVFAKRLHNKSENFGQEAPISSTNPSVLNPLSGLAELDTNTINPANRNIISGNEVGGEVRTAFPLLFNETTDEIIDTKTVWLRFKDFIESELEPDDRIIIKSLSHTLLPNVSSWEDALLPIFTGYITEIISNGSVGDNEQVVLSCKDNLYYCEISKFNIAPAMTLTPLLDQTTFRYLNPQKNNDGINFGNDLFEQSAEDFFDVLKASDGLINEFNYSPSFAMNELTNETATTAIMRLLTMDAFETIPLLTLKSNNKTIQYYLQSGLTTDQVSYNNFTGNPISAEENFPFLPDRPAGPHGRVETILAIPFFNTGSDFNASMNQYYGEWNTVLELCGSIASTVDAEFFADEYGRIVFKFPTHGVGINILPENDILPNILDGGKKVPYVIQDRNIISWEFKEAPPACTVIKASASVGVNAMQEPDTAFQNVVIIRFNGLTTLGDIPIGGGENLISKYGIRAQVLAPSDLYLPGPGDIIAGSINKHLRANLAQYAMMKGELMNDLARHSGSIRVLEDSIIRMGQPIIIESQLREGDFEQFGFPKREYYYVQGVTRNISVGNTPQMTLNLTVGRRYPELSGFERAYFSFYQYIVRKYPGNPTLIYPDNDSDIIGKLPKLFGATNAETFFREDESGNIVGPSKQKLNEITGTPSSPSSIQTRRVTKRDYTDLLPQVNEYTRASAGWQARINDRDNKLFRRPVRRSRSANIIKTENFEIIVEPLIKINSEQLPDVFPDYQEPIYKNPQSLTAQQMSDLYTYKLNII